MTVPALYRKTMWNEQGSSQLIQSYGDKTSRSGVRYSDAVFQYSLNRPGRPPEILSGYQYRLGCRLLGLRDRNAALQSAFGGYGSSAIRHHECCLFYRRLCERALLPPFHQESKITHKDNCARALPDSERSICGVVPGRRFGSMWKVSAR